MSVDLEAWIKEDAARTVEELGYDWNEIPGAIAHSAVMRLVFEREAADLTLDSTLRDIGQRLEILKEDGTDA